MTCAQNVDTYSMYRYFQWHDILQVIIPRTSAVASAAGSGHQVAQAEGHTTCPICLSPPTSPRMTKCGHVCITLGLRGRPYSIFMLGVLFSVYPALPQHFRQSEVGALPDML